MSVVILAPRGLASGSLSVVIMSDILVTNIVIIVVLNRVAAASQSTSITYNLAPAIVGVVRQLPHMICD